LGSPRTKVWLCDRRRTQANYIDAETWRNLVATPGTERAHSAVHPNQAFTDASAAVGRLEEIYERNTHFLQDHFEAY
jgi:hypothetical protein